MNRVIAELEISSSPEAAVRHALDEVSEETRELLQRAHQTAEEITARSRSRPTTAYSRPSRRRRPARGGRARRRRPGTPAMRETDELREAAQREAARPPGNGSEK